MGAEVHVALRLPVGFSALLDPVRRRLESEEAVALGAQLLREWKVEGNHVTWLVSVHHTRVGALADLMEREILFPLLVSPYATFELASCVPEIAKAGYDVHVRDDRERRQKDHPMRMVLVSERQLDAIEATLVRRRAALARTPWRAVAELRERGTDDTRRGGEEGSARPVAEGVVNAAVRELASVVADVLERAHELGRAVGAGETERSLGAIVAPRPR